MFLQRILILLSLLVTHSVGIVVLEKCKQCVDKGCGYCSRTGKRTSAYDQTTCTCNKNEFNYGQKCNDFKSVANSWNAVEYHTVKTNSSFGCHLHAEPAKTKSLIALFSILVGGSIIGLFIYLCRLHCPKRGKGSVGNKALLLEPDPLEDAIDEAERVADIVMVKTEEAVDGLIENAGQAVDGAEQVLDKWLAPPPRVGGYATSTKK
jgi:hypothetical protein